MESTEDEEWANKTNQTSRKVARYKLPISYGSKIQSVLAGSCTQTIRAGRKYLIGDKITFYSWDGPAYKKGSTWINRTDVILNGIILITISEEGITYPLQYPGQVFPWTHERIDELANEDFIHPATGLELKKVLFKYIKVSPGQEVVCQILRW